MTALGRVAAITLDVLAVLSSIIVVGLMLTLVVARYVLEVSVVGLHELILLFAVQLYMSGALIAARRNGQITVDWLAQRLTGRASVLHDLAVALITLAVSGFFLLWAVRMLQWGTQRPQSTPIFDIPLWVPQLAILVGAVGCLIYAVRDVIVAGRTLARR